MKKLSKSDQPIDEQKAQELTDREKLKELMSRPHVGTQIGDGCTVWIDGKKRKAHYTETGWELEDV